jgi:V/A-type H+-transporting ATPase subunit E
MSVPTVKEGLSAIAREVLDDVRKEAENIIATSEKNAKQTLLAAKNEAEENYQAIFDKGTSRTDAEKRRIASLTEVEMRNQLLQTKEALVDEAFNKGLSRLMAFTETKDYHNYLLTLIEKSAKAIDSKNLIVHINAKDKEWLTQKKLNQLSTKLRLTLSLAKTNEEAAGGCKLEAADGKIVSDNTFEDSLESLKPALRAEVARILFGKEA